MSTHVPSKSLARVVIAAVAVMFAAAAAILLLATGQPTLQQRMQDEDPQVRVKAVVEAGQSHDKKMLGLMVERLNDSEDEVRFFTIMALQRMTGQTMDYRFYDRPEAEAGGGPEVAAVGGQGGDHAVLARDRATSPASAPAR